MEFDFKLIKVLQMSDANQGELYTASFERAEDVFPGIERATAMGLFRKVSIAFDDIDIWQMTDEGYAALGKPRAPKPSPRSMLGLWSLIRSRLPLDLLRGRA